MELVLASKNRHKLAELREILQHSDVTLRLQSELGVDLDVEETGTTFEENALLKARAVCQATGLPAIADDSGLVVDALGGAPGIYSARYGGDACRDDRARCALLLREMEAVPEGSRSARFVCVIAAVFPDGRQVVARGCCEGSITRAPAGEDGFGYDPVFYLPAEGCTFAQMPAERKNAISHRANALRLFQKKLFEV